MRGGVAAGAGAAPAEMDAAAGAGGGNLGATPGRHLEERAGRKHGRVPGHPFVEQGGQLQIPEQVEGVVRCCAVGSQPDLDAGGHHRRQGRNSGSELEVADRVVRHPDVELFEITASNRDALREEIRRKIEGSVPRPGGAS